MKLKIQLPIVIRLVRGCSIVWLGIEWRSPCRPIDRASDLSDFSGMLKSYED